MLKMLCAGDWDTSRSCASVHETSFQSRYVMQQDDDEHKQVIPVNKGEKESRQAEIQIFIQVWMSWKDLKWAVHIKKSHPTSWSWSCSGSKFFHADVQDRQCWAEHTNGSQKVLKAKFYTLLRHIYVTLENHYM